MSNEAKVVLVTGGARGIGWATAETFMARGWNVTILDVSGFDAVHRHKNILALPVDVTDRAAMDTAFNESFARWGRLDAVVNNAGIQRHGALETLPVENWNAVIDINLHGTFHGLQAAARTMLPQGFGAIVNLASVAANRGAPGRAAYAASKAAIVSLTKTAAVEWSERGVRVNAVAPGYVETDLVAAAVAEGRIDLSPVIARTPARRLAKPEEIAKAIYFLCSDEASYVTGHVLQVDGGFDADYGVPFSAPKQAPGQ